MATTKIINDLIDLNQTGNTTALKGCVGENANQPADPTISVQYLVVGGGGGANGSGSGGGGAGGFSTGTIAVPNNTAVSIVIGQGGLGVLNKASNGLPAGQGQDSGFYTIQGQGGGAGAHRGNGLPGGSGGGGGNTDPATAFTGGSGVSSQGNNGGSGTTAAIYVTGGGGGASTLSNPWVGIGNDGVASQSGHGGTGEITTIISTTNANASNANVGQQIGGNLYFAGGGGGGGVSATVSPTALAGDGGSGGGGAGSATNSVLGVSGTINTGGGGGGGNAGTTDTAGGSGGSGVVILKYANTANETITGSLAGGITTGTTTDCNYPVTGNALYQLENNLNDTCSGGYNGSSTVPPTYGTGKFGTYSAVFNGTSQYFDVISSPNNTSVISVSMWFKTTNTSASPQTLWNNGGANGAETGLCVRLNAGVIELVTSGSGSSTTFTSSGTFNDGNWHNLVVTYNSGPFVMYIDGNSLLTGTSTRFTSGTSTKTLRFGAFSYSSLIDLYTGDMDQIRIFPTILTADQAAMLYAENEDKTKFTESSDTVLVFKGGSGTINLTDTSLLGPKVGDLRTNTDQTSANSASAMEHYMSTGWRVFNNYTTSICNYPITASGLFQLENNIDNTCGGGTPSQNGNITFTTSEKRFGAYSAVFADNGKLDTAITPGSGDWSVSLWLNPDTPGYFGGTTNGSVQYGIYMYGYTSGTIQLQNRDTGTMSDLSVSGILPFGSWTHVVITHSSNLTTLYTDKSSRGTLSGNPTHSTNFIFGQSGNYTPSGDLYDGYMDQIRIFPSVLTASQITELYNETSF